VRASDHGGHEAFSTVKAIDLEVVIDWNGLKVHEEVCESAIPVKHGDLILGLGGIGNLLVKGIEGDNVTEQVLEPCGEPVCPSSELTVLQVVEAPGFEAYLKAVA